MSMLQEWIRRHPSELGLTAFLHGELSDSEYAETVSHVESCVRCKEMTKRLEGAARLWATDVVGDVSADIVSRGRETLSAALRSGDTEARGGEDRKELLAQVSVLASSYLGEALSTELVRLVQGEAVERGLTAEEALDCVMPRLASLIGDEAALEFRKQVRTELMGAS